MNRDKEVVVYIRWNTTQPRNRQNPAISDNVDGPHGLSEVSQAERDKYRMISLICEILNT